LKLTHPENLRENRKFCMKYAVVILDGASGEPLAAHGGRTTLEAAATPHLDALATSGLVGLAKNVPDGLEPSSNIACTSICGFDPACYPIGRGALEGAALDITLADDEIALRLNLTHVDERGIMVSYSTGNISQASGQALLGELAAALDDETFKLHPGAGFRGILVVKGHPQLMRTTLTPAHNMTDEPVANYPASGPEAALIEDYRARARAVLAASPTNAHRSAAGLMTANEVFIFWPGQRPAGMASFRETYATSAGMLSGVDLLGGIAKLAGIKNYHFAGITDGPDNDYAAQARAALAVLAERDLVFVHVEAPDAEGHDGNVAGKLAAVEAIDREIISRLIAYAKEQPLRIMALPDHPTPVALKRHTRELVPFVLAGPGIVPAVAGAPAGSGGSAPTGGSGSGGGIPATRLTEAQAAATGIVVDPGYLLMARLLAQ
jgi:2,3-bisphosphoglycerate-independent phosphoglycerate mutase